MTIASSPAASATAAKFQTLLTAARRVLAAYAEQPGDTGICQELLKVRRELAVIIAGLPASEKTGPLVEAAGSVLHVFEESGVADQPAETEDLALVEGYRKRNWPGLLASMLLVPAWQWPSAAPTLDEVQPWLWAEYTRWLFSTPKGFAAGGQPAVYAAHYLKRLEELASWGTRNRGSAAVRIALQVYMQGSNCIPLYFDTGSLRRHCELRGKILTIAAGVPLQEDMLPSPRDGRRLRIGFVNRHFGQQTETYTTLPMFEHLDPARFEVLLFANHATDSVVEAHCRRHAAEFHLLPKDVDAQLDVIRAAYPDILVFGTNVTAVFHEVTRLALYRLAPLQVINNSSCVTSGLPHSDLYLSGSLTETPQAQEHFTERLGLIPGPTHAFQYEVDRAEPTSPWNREALGLPADAVVFVTAANYFKIIPEMQQAWARLLAAVPGSRLLVHPFNPNWSSTYPIKRFCAEFDRVLARHGVGPERLVVSTNKFPSRSDVKELLGVGDIYLDTFPFGGVNSLVDPLELGLPVIAWEGETFRARMGGALLRSLGLDELVVSNETDYLALATALAGDAPRRAALKQRIGAAMERAPIFLDTLAHSDAVGDLLEAAYDQLSSEGRETFRANRVPLVAAEVVPAIPASGALAGARRAARSNPADPAVRRNLGRALLDEGQVGRAVEYFVAAVQHDEGNTALWFETAMALKRNGQKQQAIEALETCLQVDRGNVDAWLMFAELARDCGKLDLAREAAGIVKTLAPGDLRVDALLF